MLCLVSPSIPNPPTMEKQEASNESQPGGSGLPVQGVASLAEAAAGAAVDVKVLQPTSR